MERNDAYKIYLLTRFVQSLLFTMIGAYTALYRINVVGLNPLQLVLVGTVLEITTFFFEVPTGVVADVYSRKLSTVIGVILVGLGFMFEAAFPTFATVLIAQVIWGIGFTFVSGAREAWIAGEVGTDRANKAFFKAAQIVHIGAFIGVIIAIPLAGVSVRLPIVVGGVLHAIWGICLFFLMPEKNFTSTKTKERTNWQHMVHTFKSGIGVVLKSKLLLLVVIAGGMYGMFSEGFDRLWTVHLVKNFSFPIVFNLSQTTWFGIIFLITLLFTFVGVTVVNKLVKQTKEQSIVRSFIWLITLLIVVSSGFALANNFYIAVFFTWFIYMFREATYPLYSGILNKESIESSRATTFSIASQANAVGQIAGGPLLGFIATYYSLRVGMLTVTLSLIPVLILFYFGLQMVKKDMK